MRGIVAAVGVGLAALSVAVTAGAQEARTIPVMQFSPEFSASVTVDQPGEWGSPGRVTVREQKTGRRVLEVEASGLSLPDGGDASANVVERPYGTQSVVIYQDFDFDGRADFALQDGNNSCYSGPSYQVFLRRGKGFRKSAAFTRLAQEYCGMFGVEAEHKQLSTFWKSGCCQHGFQTWEVRAGVPIEIADVTEDYLSQPGYLMTTQSAGKAQTVTYSLPPGEDWEARPLLSFELQGAQPRRVAVFEVNGHLDYALTEGDGNVELSYAVHVLRQRDPASVPFEWDNARAELSFKNGQYRYVVHDSKDRLGVSVVRRGHETFLPAKPESRVGALTQIAASELDNVRAVTLSGAMPGQLLP
jgi:hypothetical protein